MKKANKGLFSFGRQSKKIEEYNNKESKIKTNNIIEDLYRNKENNVKQQKENGINEPGTTLNTQDVLDELKKMRTEIEEDLEKNSTKEIILEKEKIEEKTINKSENKSEEKKEMSEEELQKKVDGFLKNASKIKEKNSKILEKNYDPLKDLKDKKITELNYEEIENSIKADLKNLEQKDIENKEITDEKEKNEIIQDDNIDTKDGDLNTNNEKQQNDENIEIKKENETNEKANKQEEKSENKDNEITEKEEKLEYIKDKINQIEENNNIVTEDFKEMYAKLFGTVPKTEEDIKKEREEEELNKKINATDIVKDNVSLFDNEEEYEMPKYKFLGIAFKTYIILEMDKEIYILDQHAAHERIMYEKVKNNYYSNTEKDSQMLLLPDIITLTHKEMDIARDNKTIFEKAGFVLEEFGENTIKLTGCPTICLDLDTKELFLETLDEIDTVARTAKQEREEKFIETVACKAAVKAHMALSKEEVDSLMHTLLQLPNPFTCPHGRPTAIKMTKYDIERKFSRK